MFRRSFFGSALAVLSGLVLGRKCLAAPAPSPRLVPAHIERHLDELDSTPEHKEYFSVQKVDGREVWARCYF